MGDVVVLNEIPDSQGSMKAIEDVFCEALAPHPGSWKVRIVLGTWPPGSWVPAATAARWAIVLTRDGEPFQRTLLLDPGDQRPEHLATSLPALLPEPNHEGTPDREARPRGR